MNHFSPKPISLVQAQPLERVLEPELNDSRRHGGCGDVPETGRTNLCNRGGELCCRLARELRRVEGVEELRAELNGARLAQAAHVRVLENGHIHIVLPGSVDNSAAERSEACTV